VTVIIETDETTDRCPDCGWDVVSKYRLETEAPEEAACGDCFAEWLATQGARVRLT
jgi:hypothetical protein